MNYISIAVKGIKKPVWLHILMQYTHQVLNNLAIKGWEISIVICNDRYIQKLNNLYRKKNEATDVLSFRQGDSYTDVQGRKRYLAGDIVISLVSLARNAKTLGIPKDEELKRLLIHAILHLAGYDHKTNLGRAKNSEMLQLQETVLSTLHPFSRKVIE